jgi:hypothetical protein
MVQLSSDSSSLRAVAAGDGSAENHHALLSVNDDDLHALSNGFQANF